MIMELNHATIMCDKVRDFISKTWEKFKFAIQWKTETFFRFLAMHDERK
jgi:hypothetical protein